MYAIIATGGKQYKVSEGDVINVEKIDAEAGNTVTFDQVIAVSDNTLKVGAAVANNNLHHAEKTLSKLERELEEKKNWLDDILEEAPVEEENLENRIIDVAIVGRPNVGKP